MEERILFLESNEKLFQDLLHDYEPAIPPIYTKRNYIDPMSTNYSKIPKDNIVILLLNAKIVEVNPMKQLMTIIFHYTTLWVDQRLMWDPANYHNITTIYVPRKRVWIPDISVFDSTYVKDTRSKRNQWVKLIYNGLCLFAQSTVTSVNCIMSVDDFPFDSHSCSVRMLSNSLSIAEIEITNSISEGNTFQRVGNNEWEVLNISRQDGIIFPNEAVQQIEFIFLVRRNPMFYMFLIILPTYIMSAICIAGFFTSNLIIDDDAKYELGLTTIMSMAVMLGVISELVPKSDKNPKLTNYALYNLTIILVAMSVVIGFPKLWQFISLIFTSCKKNKKGWFRRYFWIFRGFFTAICFVVFEFAIVVTVSTMFTNKKVIEWIASGFAFENGNLTFTASL